MLSQCQFLYTDGDRDSSGYYHKGHHRSYDVSAAHYSLQRVEAHLSRGFQTTSYIVYNEYSITSDYSSDGTCMITEGVPIGLQTPFSYTVTAGENQSLQVQYLGLSSFQNFLGFVNCDIGELAPVTPNPLSPTVDGPSIPVSSVDPSTSASIASAVANVTSSATTDRQKAAIGTAIPVGGIALLVLALFLWQRKKRQRAKRTLGQTVQEERTEDNPPFLQPKPELQGEDSRHEMLAEDRIFELDEGNTRYEIMTEEQNRRMNVQVQKQELRGEEFAVEIDDRDTRAEC